MGVSSAVSLSALSGIVPDEFQGRAFGLRMTINRALSAALPVVMGAVVEIAGLEMAFYLVCALALAVLTVAALAARRLAQSEITPAAPVPVVAEAAVVMVPQSNVGGPHGT